MNLSPIDFVNRAVSTDEGRHNMTGAYRDSDKLIATDGHRLHMVSGLVKQEKGGFVDGRDAQFPNYEMVLPKSPEHVADLKITKRQVQYLNKVVKTLRDRTCGCKFEFEPSNGLTISGESKGEGDTFGFTLRFPSVQVKKAYTIGLNLRYFIEAIIPDYPMSFSKATEKEPNTLEADFGGSKYSALIMAIRLD